MGQVSPPQKTEFPFNVATTQASRALIRVHQYLRGEMLKRGGADDVLVSPEVCHRQMAAIETVLGFLGANFDPSALKARRAYPKIGPLNYAQVRAGVLSALKGAGDWRTYNELADHIVALHKLQLTSAQRKHFLQKLREGTHALKRAGAVVCERPARLGENTFEQRWRLSSLFD
jgi:hypothetical protein